MAANPPGLAVHLRGMPADVRRRILAARAKGVLPVNRVAKYAFATPHGVKANCYAHFLTLPEEEWTDRRSKSQPGEKCNCTVPLAFPNRERTIEQLLHRVACDNPGSVFYMPPGSKGYAPSVLTMRLPRGYVLGCCIVGANDYHFLRREGVAEILNNAGFQAIWRRDNADGVQQQLRKLLHGGKHQYCWSHVAGWSGGLRVVDAQQRVIVNPVDRRATQPAAARLRQHRCDHAYDDSLVYDSLAGFFVVRARRTSVRNDNKRPRNDAAVEQRLRSLGMQNATLKTFRKPATP